MNEEAISWLKDVLSKYENKNNRDEDKDIGGCKHEYQDRVNYDTICCDCGLYLKKQLIHDDFFHYKNYNLRRTAYHSTKTYFVKNMEKYTKDLTYDRERLLRDFDTQEQQLKFTLMTEMNRKNSLNVNYKLFKLLQHQGISYNKIKLPKCIDKHDKILKPIWFKLNWDWVQSC